MKHKAEYLLPGSFFPEETVKELPERSVEAAIKAAPGGAFCFVLYDVEETPDLGPDFTVLPKPKNKSGRYYLGGEVFTPEQIAALPDQHEDRYDVLLSNMRSNKWDRVIRCRTGNWQPFTDEDILVEPAPARGRGSQ